MCILYVCTCMYIIPTPHTRFYIENDCLSMHIMAVGALKAMQARNVRIQAVIYYLFARENMTVFCKRNKDL